MTAQKLMLHVCCAPCSTHVIEKLREDYDLTCYFYGPNIHPEEEYRRRLEEARDYCGSQGIAFVEGEYDASEWLEAVKGHEEDAEGGERCKICYEFRLKNTAEAARRLGFDPFTTTLTLSPHKKADVINEIGRQIGARTGIRFLEEDFKKMDGFKRSVQMSKDHGLYRQSYCGCEFSKR
ncbi:MAG: epoxyqueuosine reductase QueH [Methanobacteriota archaeon]|nr:MAG: epoxyqueuosine reductase QueH [Euryarchaeota archaeon]